MDIQEGTYTYTGYGDQKYKVPIERVYSFSQLHKGDHIAFERRKGFYWHHAIVEDVETEKGIIMIEYSNSAKEFSQDNSSSPKNPGLAKVRRHEYSESKDGLYLIKHDKCMPADTVVLRARSKLGEKKYNPFTNNCEHFVLWCKTGISSSEQVKNIKEMAKKTAKEAGLPLVVGLVAETGEKIVMTVRATLNGAKKEALRVFHFHGAKTEAMQWVLKKVDQIAAEPVVTQYLAKGGQIMLQYGVQMALGLCFPSLSNCEQAMMLNGGEMTPEQLLFQSISKGRQWFIEKVAQIAAERVTQALSKGSQWVLKKVAQMAAEPAATQTSTTTTKSLLGGAVCGALIEGAIGLYDIYWAYAQDLKEGKISQGEYNDAVGKRIMGGVGKVTGATAGAAVGQLLPFLVVGGIVGSVVGGLAGRYLGGALWGTAK